MKQVSGQLTGKVLQIREDNRLLVEIYRDLAIGEIIRFNSPSSWATHEKVISRMESEEGQTIYRAHQGERVILEVHIPLQPGDSLEKLAEAGCLKIEALIDPSDICFLNGLLEGHNDMAVLRTLDGSRGLVQILASPCYQEEIFELLLSLRKEMPLEIKAVIQGATMLSP